MKPNDGSRWSGTESEMSATSYTVRLKKPIDSFELQLQTEIELISRKRTYKRNSRNSV
jgi:hypothetical protein